MLWSQRAFHKISASPLTQNRGLSFLSPFFLILCLVAPPLLVLSAPMGVSAERGRPRTHTVRRGENLGKIAARYGVATDDLAVANDINPESALSIGTKLEIPARGGPYHRVVRTGETASQIARDNDCTVSELMAYNKLGRRARLRAGQVLKIPPRVHPERRGGARGGRLKRHTVAEGESLNEIAHQYGIGTNALKRANKIRNPRLIRPGRVLVIPEKRSARSSGKSLRPVQQTRRISGARQGPAVIHWVVDGQSWRSISNAYRVRIATLRKVNPRLKNRLIPGQQVRIPGAEKAVSVPVANCGYPGIRFVRRDRERTIRLLNCHGRVSPAGRRQLSQMASSRRSGAVKLLNIELVKRIQRVGDEFPGRPIRIISGYRPPAGERAGSRHNYGRAMDINVEGIPNRELFRVCRSMPTTGCGFYPNSTFVHIDYRDESANWIDYAGPGESPDYAPRETARPRSAGGGE